MKPALNHDREPAKFPAWFEPVTIAAALTMACVEGWMGSIGWAAIFGMAGVAFGLNWMLTKKPNTREED